MLVLDTSGSMAWDFSGATVYGDGVEDNCTFYANVGYQCGPDCTAGERPLESRIRIAREAITNLVLSYGDVQWGLSRFEQTTGLNINTESELQGRNCDADGPNPPNFAAPTTNYSGTCNGADILVGFSAFAPFTSPVQQTNALLSWIDNTETNYNNSTTTGHFCNTIGGGNCEVRPDGSTPIARSLDDVRTYLTPIQNGDLNGTAPDARACRPYAVVLITDGQDTCPGNPVTAAAALLAQGINTYVIGLASGAALQTELNNIATAGGTDAGAPGGNTAFFASNPDELSAGLAAIVAESLIAEECGNGDEDCDGLTDEGFTKYCSNPAMPGNLDLCFEPADACDGVDSDCDGTIDEGTTNACGGCGAVPAEICDGLDNNCNGVIDEGNVCAGCVPSPFEICDNIDNDCDTRIDEGVSRACGNDVGLCTTGTEICTAGTFGACSGTEPVSEVCDGQDNDCDGIIDGNTRPCGSSVGACRPGTEQCTASVWGSCVGAIGPTAEICDLIDNNCNGSTDEGNPGGGAVCGTAAGICTEGTTSCVGGMLVCTGGTDGVPEMCNLLDDDCDGLTDEGNPMGGTQCGTTDVGECDFGAEVCEMGMLTCRGATGPSAEICDGRDNDCDGNTDEMNPEGGMACGDGTGECEPGTTACIGGMLVCQGEVGPTPEVCDGLDNNCNGVEDEGIGVGAPCGTDAGECSPGVNICRDGMLVCDGATMMREEVCNALDDDCDGTIDEALPLGGACGNDTGICMAGALQCIDGDEICVGEVPAGTESCDCEDNDCDDVIDEDVDGSLCPGDSECVECGCSSPCMRSEFGFTCPGGRTAFLPGGPGTDVCFCVTPRCEEDACGMETVERDGETLCAPGADPATCTCKNNACTFPCDGVLCADGTVCRADSGRCVEDSCRGLGCPDGELCDVATGACEVDPCATVMCADGEACRGGECEGTCVDVECPSGQDCRAGECVMDRCADVVCSANEACDPDTGGCVPDMCLSVRCPLGFVCESVSGECQGDPCEGLNCPGELICDMGECVDPATLDPDGGPGADTGAGEDAGVGGRVLASGGGGCACDAAGATSTRSPVGPAALILLFLGFLGWRRAPRLVLRGAKVGAGISGALALLLSGGCDVDPFCLDCVDAATVDSGLPDAIRDNGPIDVSVGDTGNPDVFDAGPDTGGDVCLGAELCNEMDDDCDGEIDEEIDEQTDINNCGGCGILCAPPAAFGVCRGGECFIDECDVNARDLNGDPADGCEYTCLPTADDDTLCDLRDNDCDGAVDEDISFDTDPVNCGTCASVCRFAHVTSPTCTAGDCAFDPADCETDFYDINGVPDDGCEYSCTPATPATETCNGRDDDCDGDVDEGNPGGGDACGSAMGACVRGVNQCVSGAVVCVGGVREIAELCNGDDDDCDGLTDENNPEGGRLCGESVGACQLGRETCVGGALSCVGDTGPVAETCDGLDNDCNGAIDNGNPGGGAACGETRGICTAGALACSGGTLACVGATGGTIESCNSLDDDCDGNTDETFLLQTDLNNCGICGRVCSFTNGFPTCTAGSCELAGCETGFVDRDMNPATGCEYACNFTGNEICNGLDDDCDGNTDESLTPPANFCNPNGVCAGTTATCGGGAGWSCAYGGSYQETETRCDGADNDCDGGIDESFPTLGDLCSNGRPGSECERFGIRVCDGLSAVRCNAPSAGTPGPELCNNLDDDCDGIIDNGVENAIPSVTLNISGTVVEVMQYEASRPDATGASSGGVNARACSNPGVLPWTNVTWPEARDACAALPGWTLCEEDHWEASCAGTATCDWSYASACTTSASLTCNGLESGFAMMSIDVDTTASYASCYTNYAPGVQNRLYDMSGNVKEWTRTARGTAGHAIRGGSYNNIEQGRACQFDFTVGDDVFAFPNTGFRCCRY